MSRISSFVIGVIFGAILTFVSTRYYIVQGDDGIHLVPRITHELSMPYVDVREFDIDDWNNHRGLALALIQAGKQDMLKGAAIGGLQKSIDLLFEGLRKGF